MGNSALFDALADSTRRRMLARLAAGPASVQGVAAGLGVSLSAVSQHLKVLRDVDLVAVRESGRRRLYRLNGAPLKTIHDWVRSYEQSWSEAFDRMDIVLGELRSQEDQ